MKKTILFFLALVCVVTAFVWLAPGFLFTDDLPRKADAVVLFVGPGNESRLDEAKQLIREGYARYLLIPSYGEIYALNGQGALELISGTVPRKDLILKVRLAATYKKYYENTHIEALEAKRMLDDLGLRSALLVSSAYHMRRIGLIAGKVFDWRKYSISCNPARWQASFTAGDWLNRDRRKIIASEYVKIAWFLAYGVFGF
ncbi:YdcF family protein [Geobacter argillaceus]|uniref:DUF218 domain-containing protein n=1 Tax=Geobacter argillaceus TaxID=345631 RepID=A0A562VFN5_9BACT|nr:YdcF family protein [Geobacter argillaceus]TWJ16720.1 DUF218 domain-containing protein [Geobacter argillaceus]